MSDLSDFTLVRELAWTSHSTLHEATLHDAPPSGNSGAKITLKTYNPPYPRGPRRQADLLAFQDAADTQAKMHRACPHHWAPVTASGISPRNATAWLAAPYYPRTLQKAVAAKLVLPLPALHVLVSNIIAALAELERHASRHHGALTPANIYLPGNAPLRKSTLLLAHPAPLPAYANAKNTAAAAHAAGRLADNHALGLILATLIRQREQVGGHIEDGPEWNRLGKHAPAWREFCNYLLDPPADPATATIAELQRRFSRLGGRDSGTRAKILFTAAPLLLLAAPLGFLRLAPFENVPESLQEFSILLGNHPPDLEEVPPEFGQLCTAWYEWFAALGAELGDPATHALWAADPWLAEHVLPIATPGPDRAALDPRALTVDTRNFEALRATPPPAAKQGTVVRRTRLAAARITTLAENINNWPGNARLAETAQALDTTGFHAAATSLRLPPPPVATGLPAQITHRLQLLATANTAATAWRNAEEIYKELAATRDPVLTAIRATQLAALADAPLEKIPAQIAANTAKLDPRLILVRTRWNTRIDHTRWLKEGFVATHTGPADDATLARWDAAIADYSIATPDEDPRNAIDWRTLETRLTTALDALTSLDTRLNDAPTTSRPLGTDANATRLDTRALLSAIVIRKDIAAVTRQTADLNTHYQKLLENIADATRELNADPREWLAYTRSRILKGHPALSLNWSTRRDRFLDGITPDTLADIATFRALRIRIRKTYDILNALQGETLLSSIPPLAALPPDTPEAVSAQIQNADTTRTEATLNDLLAQITWDADGTPQTTPETFAAAPAVKTRLDAFRQWRLDAAATAPHFTTLARLFAQGYTLDHPPLADTAAKLDANPALPDIATGTTTNDTIPAAAHPQSLLQTLHLLRALDAATARPPLLDALRAPAAVSFSVALTAWRRLDTLPDWPIALAELDTDLSLQDTLAAQLEKLTAAGRPAADITALREEFTAAARHRWRRAYAQIPPVHTPAVLARLPKTGLTPADLTALDQFDRILATAKTTPWHRLTERDAKTTRDALLAQSRDALATNPEPPARLAALAYLDSLAQIPLNPDAPEITPADIGPGRLGWAGRFADENRRLTYTWQDLRGDTHTQEYLLVEPADDVPFYLSTRAISLGEFIALIETRPAGADVLAAMPAWLADISAGTDTDTRSGPQTWRILAPRRATPTRLNDSRMAPNTRWTAYLDPRWPDPLYPSTIAPPATPTRQHPIQNIPPAAARLFAEKILGARLPAPDEWRALARTHADLARPDAPGANYSDATWLTQRDYLVGKGVGLEAPWPDIGAFQPPGAPIRPRHAAATPRAPGVNDNTLWFSEVGVPGASVFTHLFGNVATWLHDPEGKRYYVAGASAISPAEIDPAEVYPADQYSEGYADVGLRPALEVSPSMIQRSKLISLIRKQSYLRQEKK